MSLLNHHSSMTKHSVRRIRFLKELTNAQNYLEIGVQKGDTFFELDFEHKTGVDPKFLFDASSYRTNSIELEECTSDHYFQRCISHRLFDIIFLDGMHTYDQTFRDFLNSLSRSHPRTFFLIDDTIPSDRYSAMRNREFSISERKRAFPANEKPGMAWHGDTYKCLFLIKYFCSSLQYATIIRGGNPQTLLWNPSAFNGINDDLAANVPFHQFNDMRYLLSAIENIRLIDYDWTMQNCHDIFQQCTENDLFEYLGDYF